MSTRAFIKFVGNGESLTIYHHWDGYPSYVMPELEEFLIWNGFRADSVSYTVANFVTWDKVRSALRHVKDKYFKDDPKHPKSFEELFKKADFNDYLHTGFGLHKELTDEQIIESWAEWYYVVDFDARKITAYAVLKEELHKVGNSEILYREKETHTPYPIGLKHTKRLVKEIEAQ